MPPLCGECETTIHVRVCMDEGEVQHFRDAMEKLNQWMLSEKTEQHIHMVIKEGLLVWNQARQTILFHYIYAWVGKLSRRMHLKVVEGDPSAVLVVVGILQVRMAKGRSFD